jgi:uncharacterized membrane protein YphA (DoxX/SURF4 family)
MNLVNFKKIAKEPEDLLRIIIAVVFISAGIFRIFNPEASRSELQALNVPQITTWLIIFLEVLGGLYLLFKIKYWKNVVYMFIIFLLTALWIALKVDAQNILNNLEELFVFDVNPTDLFLHIIFIIILLSLVLKKKSN